MHKKLSVLLVLSLPALLAFGWRIASFEPSRTPAAAPTEAIAEVPLASVPSASPTHVPSATPEPSEPPAPTRTTFVDPTATPLPPSSTPTQEPAPTATPEPPIALAQKPEPDATATVPPPTATATSVPSPTATATPAPSATSTPTPVPTVAPSPVPSPTPRPPATATPVPSPTRTPAPTPTATVWEPIAIGLAVSPNIRAAAPGESATYQVTVTRLRGNPGRTVLRVSGLPDSVTASFDPPEGGESFTSTLTLSVDSSVASGAYNFTVEGLPTRGVGADDTAELRVRPN